MKPEAFQALATLEHEGWYYRARSRALQHLIRSLEPQRAGSLRILDVGCGTGGTTQSLTELGDITGVEPSPQALDMLRSRFPHLRALQGDTETLPNLVPHASFDLAVSIGVISQLGILDPQTALANMAQTLKPGGWLIWNDAVYPMLRRAHDVQTETVRRFTPRQMNELLAASGLEVRRGTHFLSWGFFPALLLGFAHRVRSFWKRPAAENSPPPHGDDLPMPGLLNTFLEQFTYAEWRIAHRFVALPWGVSYLVAARKPMAAIDAGLKNRNSPVGSRAA